MMSQFVWKLLVTAATTSALLLAQGPRGPQGNSNASRTGLALDMTRQQTIEGTITSIQIAYGTRYPSVVVSQSTIRVAPVWFLLENDFELPVGEVVRIVAAPGVRNADTGLHAITVVKVKTGTELVLRSQDGLPLWSNRQRGRSEVARQFTPVRGGSVDPASVGTMSGLIESANAGIGIQQPSLTLQVGDKLMTFKLGPERLLLESDFELKAGSSMSVKYGLATCSNELLALALTDASGETIVLRNDDGRPAWD